MSAVLDQISRTFISSVVFVDIIGYSKRTVSEQIMLKRTASSLLSAALSDISPGSTPDPWIPAMVPR